MSAELFVAMLKTIMRHRRTPLYMVLDSLPAHKAKMVREYVESTNGKLELHFLLGYAPELNPDELEWSYVKQVLQDRIEADLLAIQSNPTLVRSFFKASSVSYIID
jgi:transposase